MRALFFPLLNKRWPVEPIFKSIIGLRNSERLHIAFVSRFILVIVDDDLMDDNKQIARFMKEV